MAGPPGAGAGAGGPPPEMIPGYYDDRSWVVIFYVTLCLTVATTMVVLRTWTRRMIINKMGIDDYLAIVTLLIAIGEGTVIALSTQYGLGRHIFAVEPPMVKIPLYWKCFWVTLLLYQTGLLAAKMTFLFQYYRILAIERMVIVYKIAIVVVGCWGFAQVLLALLICRPINGLWDKTVKADCMPNAPQIYVNAAGNIVTDILIFLLPLPAIKGLNLRKPQKAMLLGIFSLGFFTVAISVIRIKFLDLREDVTWQHVESSGWSIGEICSAITCACLPTLRPFIAKYFPALEMTGRTGGANSNGSYYPPTIGGGPGHRPGQSAYQARTGSKKSGRTGASVDSFHFADKDDYELGLPSSAGRDHSTDDNTGKSYP